MTERIEVLDVLRAFDKAAAELEHAAADYSKVRARRVAADWQRDLTQRAQELADEWNDCGAPGLAPIDDLEWNSAAQYRAAKGATC